MLGYSHTLLPAVLNDVMLVKVTMLFVRGYILGILCMRHQVAQNSGVGRVRQEYARGAMPQQAAAQMDMLPREDTRRNMNAKRHHAKVTDAQLDCGKKRNKVCPCSFYQSLQVIQIAL